MEAPPLPDQIELEALIAEMLEEQHKLNEALSSTSKLLALALSVADTNLGVIQTHYQKIQELLTAIERVM